MRNLRSGWTKAIALLLVGIVVGWAGRALWDELLRPPPARSPLPQGYGVAVGYGQGSAADLDRLGPVWYYDYSFRTVDWPGHTHLLLVSARDGEDAPEISAAAAAHPGHWWIVGNEPNDPAQDNLSAVEYAHWFARTSGLIRQADP